MKKTLTKLTFMVFTAVVSLSVSAQNNRLKGAERIQKNNFASPRVPGNVVINAQKNAPGLLSPASLSGYYYEDFESAFPPTGWQALDILDPAAQWAQSPTLPYSGLNSAYMVFSAIGVDGEDWLVLPKFTVAATDSFSFWLAAEFVLYPPDTTYILVSTTDSLPSSFTTVLGTLAEGLNYPTTAQVYEYYSFDLSAFNGQDVFVAIANKNTFGDGIFVDKVFIGTKPTNAASVSIDEKFVPVGTNSPLATVKNDGSGTQSFPVTMTITGGYTSTKSVTNLAPGATQQVTFDPWTTVGPGNETISVQTQLTGDAISTDDSIAAQVIILEPFTNYGWVSKAPMTATRWDAAEAAINSNDTSYLYTIGGVSVGLITSDVGEYAPYSNSWSALSPLNTGHVLSSGATYNNKLYAAGGYNPFFTPVPDMQIYDPATNSWSNGSPMPTPVGDYALGIYHDSLFYYLGGYGGGAGDQDLVQIYDPATDTWTFGSNIPAMGAAWRGGISGNKVIVTAGYNQTNGILSATYVGDIDPANPTNITWAQWDDYPAGTNARLGGGASLDETSGLVVFTGGDPTGFGQDAMNYTFAYDLISNSWKLGPNKITGVNNLSNLASIVDNDSLWIAATGGLDAAGEKDVNEWLNMGPYVITTGIDNVTPSSSNFSCSPNPFVKFTDITFSLSQKADIKAIIVDVLGNQVEELCNKNFNSGNHSLRWDASGYSKGVYFCKLIVNGKSVTQKLLKY
ncbi:MAG: choice-of-anchor J domain-containing protein [Bacteroidia bacterium]